MPLELPWRARRKFYLAMILILRNKKSLALLMLFNDEGVITANTRSRVSNEEVSFVSRFRQRRCDRGHRVKLPARCLVTLLCS
jgi:hypothetical protein